MDKDDEEYKALEMIEINKAFEDLHKLEQELIHLIEGRERKDLDKIIKLIEMPYHSYTSTSSLHACTLAATCWGKEGFLPLTKIISSKDLGMHNAAIAAIETLTYLASTRPNENIEIKDFEHECPKLYAKINKERETQPEAFTLYAKEALLESIIDQEFLQTLPIIHSLLSMTFNINDQRGKRAFNTLLAACSNKWLRVNKENLEEYQKLIQKPIVSEEEVHHYISNNPYLLNPFYSFVWSKPKLGENLIADFIVRLIDDTYIVVEIEKPTDPIMNKKGDLSYQANHAIRQALEYRDWLKYNHLYIKEKFENIKEPTCLAIIGMEQSLSKEQKELLRIHNEGSNVKLAGFDWLYQRAEAVLGNLIRYGLDRFDI